MPKKPFLIGITGVPGAGKTTLSMALSYNIRTVLGIPVVSYVQEYARQYIARYGIPHHLWEQIRILEKQISEEDRAMSCDVLITDSPYPLGFLYSLGVRDPQNPKDTMLMNDLFKMMNKYAHRYDLIIHLPPVLPPVKDGIRAEYQFNQQWRDEADSEIRLICKIFPPVKFAVLDTERPADWDKLSPTQQREAISKLRLTQAIELIKNTMAENA